MSKRVKRSMAVVLCLVFLGALCGCNSGAQGGPSEALKEYFDACNAMDMEAIHNASYPEGMEGYYSDQLLSETDYDFYNNWRVNMGFARSRLDLADYIKFNPELVIFDDYPNVTMGPNGELLNYDREEITLEEALPNFSVTYHVEEMESLKNCTLNLRDGLSLIKMEDMDRIVALKDGSFLDVDEMYVAQVQVEWYYGNKLYGYNKSWWNDEEFCKLSPYASYEDAIEDYENTDHVMIIYKYDDEWYVYPEKLNAASFMYKAEF